MYRIITCFEDIDKNQWDKLLQFNKHGNIFQTQAISELFHSTMKTDLIVVACLDKGDELVGILVAEIQQENLGLLGKFSARAIVMGGPIVKYSDSLITEILTAEFDKLCYKRVIYNADQKFVGCWIL